MRWLIFIILSGIFLITPYFKGLYYNSDFYGISIFLFILYFILIVRLYKKKKLISIQLVIPIMLLPTCYLISFLTAENPKGALDSIILWTSYACFFVLLFWSAGHERIKASLPFIFQLTGIWITFFTLLVYYEVLNLRSAFVAGRFASIFQYPNTFGMFMAVFVLFSLIMLTSRKLSLIAVLFFSVPLVSFIVCFIQSFSRGMFLIFPICWFLCLFLLKLEKQIEYTIYTVVYFLLSIIVYKSMENGEITLSPVPGLSSLFICTFLSIIFVYFFKYFIFKKKILLLINIANKKGNHFFLPSILFFLLFFIGLDIKNNGFISQQLPEQLLSRVETINLEASTAKERLIFIEDARLISKDSPLIGFGGEAWVTIYKKYQQLPYISNKAHNGFMEMMIDTGWVGLLTFIGILLYFYLQIYKKYKHNQENSLQIAVFISSMAILLHSFLDFNFSYSTIWLTLLWLLLMGLASKSKKEQERNVNKYFNTIAISLFSLIVAVSLFFCFRLILADTQFTNFKTAKSLVLKEEALEKAISYDPYNSMYQINSIELNLNKYQKGKDIQVKERLLTAIEELTELEPNNSLNLLKAGNYAERMGEHDLAIKYFHSGLAVDKYNKQLYEHSIKLKVSKAANLLKQGEHLKARELLQSAIADYKNNVYWMDFFKDHAPENPEKFNSRKFQVTEQSHYFASLAYLELNDYKSALTAAENLDDRSIQKRKLFALIVLAMEDFGNINEAKDLTIKSELKYPNFNITLDKLRKSQGNN